MSRRNLFRKPKKSRPYAPLVAFGGLATSLFVMREVVEYIACDVMARPAPEVACTFELPGVVSFLPAVLLLFGVIGTAWRLARLKSFPELY